MLTLAGSFRLGEVTLWRDRTLRDGERRFTSRFYALRDAPRLARAADGGPAFDFLWYRRPAGDDGPEPPHGGLVILTVDLALSPKERADLAAAISRRFADLGEPLDGEVEILPVPFHDGTVELAFAGETDPAEGEGEFTRRIAGSGPARLAGHQTASFMIELNSDGAALLAEAIESGTDLFHLRYDLLFSHRLDGVKLRVWCDAERAHHATAQGRMAGPLTVPALRESLVERRIAGIEMVAAEPLDAEHQEALKTLATTVLDTALAATYGTAPDEAPGPFDPAVASRLNFTFSQSYPVEQPLALDAALTFDDPRFEPEAFAERIRKVEPGRGFFDVLEVQVFATVDFATEPIDKVKATLTYDHAAPGDSPIRRRGELVFQKGQTTGTFRTDLAAPDLRSISYEVEVHFDGGAPPMHFSHSPVETEVIVLDLDACGVLKVDLALRDAPFDRVRGAVVDLAYEDSPGGDDPAGAGEALTHRVILDQANPAGAWHQVVGDRPGELHWKAAWLGASGERIETDWQATAQRRLLLDAPAELTQRTEVELLASGDFSGLEQILVDIEPVGDSGEIDQFSFRQPGDRHLWQPAAAAGADGEFRYRLRQSLVFADGRVLEQPPVESDRRLFVVRDAGRREVQVVSRLLDLGGAWTLALLTLETGADVTDQTPPTGDRKSLVLRHPDDRPTWSFRATAESDSHPSLDYSYRLTLVPPAGERVVTPWISGRDEVLVLRPPQDNRG
ncbi:MAG: hypothetical protein AAF481_12310 [Acidobacteriota bacterium]